MWRSSALEYDASGNLIRRGELTFAYDGASRLIEAHRSGNLIGSYIYNARNQRTSKRVTGRRPGKAPAHAQRRQSTRGGPPAHARGHAYGRGGGTATVHFVYDPAGQLIAELDDAGNVLPARQRTRPTVRPGNDPRFSTCGTPARTAGEDLDSFAGRKDLFESCGNMVTEAGRYADASYGARRRSKCCRRTLRMRNGVG